MKALLLMISVSVSMSAFAAEKTAVHTGIFGETLEAIKISYEVQSENENEVVVVNPKVTLKSRDYYMFGPGGSGYSLCRALGYQGEKGNALAQTYPAGAQPELIWIDMQGSISLVTLPLKLQSAVCVK